MTTKIKSASLGPGILDAGITVNTGDPTVTSNKTPVGHLWLNSTSGETYILTDATTNANVWRNAGDGTGGFPTPYSVDFLCVGGGGSGGGPYGGGGGAGGYRISYNNETSGGQTASESPLTLLPGRVYTISIGAGGAGHSTIGNAITQGNNGASSSISGSDLTTITSIGGGGGGGRYNTNTTTMGNNGGSGGGSGDNYNATHAVGGNGTAAQGHNGGGGIHSA